MGVSAEISAAQPGGDDWESSGRFRETFCAVPVWREGEGEGAFRWAGVGGCSDDLLQTTRSQPPLMAIPLSHTARASHAPTSDQHRTLRKGNFIVPSCNMLRPPLDSLQCVVLVVMPTPSNPLHSRSQV